MKPFFLSLPLAVLVLITPLSEAVAQEPSSQLDPISPPRRSRVTADQLLRGHPVTASFDELQTFLLPGYEVVVWDTSGQKTRGRVSAISKDQIVVFREPFLLRGIRPAETDLIPRGSVTRIDIVDPTTQGTLIGAAAGAAIMLGLVQASKNELGHSNLAPVGYALLGIVAFVPSMGLGALVDWLRNSPIYEQRPQVPRVTVAPWFRPPGIGASVCVRF